MKDFKQLPDDLKKLSDNLQDAAKGKLVRIIKVEGLNHFESSFDKQGFTDIGLKKWKARKEPSRKFNTNGKRSKSYERWQHKNQGRAILVGHQTDTEGVHLKDSLQAEQRRHEAIFSTDKVYAQVHNEGGKAGRGDGFIMPQRQFMGPSRELDRNVEKKFDKEMDKLFNKI